MIVMDQMLETVPHVSSIVIVTTKLAFVSVTKIGLELAVIYTTVNAHVTVISATTMETVSCVVITRPCSLMSLMLQLVNVLAMKTTEENAANIWGSAHANVIHAQDPTLLNAQNAQMALSTTKTELASVMKLADSLT